MGRLGRKNNICKAYSHPVYCCGDLLVGVMTAIKVNKIFGEISAKHSLKVGLQLTPLAFTVVQMLW